MKEITATELTRGERLRIYRLRRGETQGAAAKRMVVMPYIYHQWEVDGECAGPVCPNVAVGPLRGHEWCMIARLRTKLTQRQVAEKIGFSRNWTLQMERGEQPWERLVEFWVEYE